MYFLYLYLYVFLWSKQIVQVLTRHLLSTVYGNSAVENVPRDAHFFIYSSLTHVINFIDNTINHQQCLFQQNKGDKLREYRDDNIAVDEVAVAGVEE